MRWRLHMWHAYSTNDALSVDYLVILTFMLKIAFSDFVVAADGA